MHRRKKTGIILICTLIGRGLFFAGSARAGRDTILQQASESLSPKATFEQRKNPLIKGDVYTHSYALVKSSFDAKVLQTITSMTREFNADYSCDLTLDDMVEIGLTIEDINSDMLATVGSILPDKKSKSSFASACVKIISCAAGSQNKTAPATQTLFDKNNGQLTSAAFTTCKSYATQAYTSNAASIGAVIALSQTTLGNDIYYNGTVDDSPYDLLVDIQYIADVLFAENEQPAKTLFFTFPQGSIAGLQAIPFDTTNSQSVSAVGSISGGEQPTEHSGGQGALDTSASTQSSNTSLLGPNRQEQQSSSLTTRGPPLLPNSAPIQNYVCLATVSTQEQVNGQENNHSQTNTPNEGNASIQGQSSPSGQPSSINLDASYNPAIVSDAIDPITANADRSDPDTYETQEKAINQCIDSCKPLPAIDEAMCVAKCMCGSVSSKEGSFKLQICTVPTKQDDIVGSTSVSSIEEIITAINAILTALKTSGEMIKHTKPTEFLDTSLSRIKLNKIFAFDVNLTFKPIPQTKPRTTHEQESQTKADQESAGNYTSIAIDQERNKYVSLYNAKEERVKKTGSITLEELQSKIATAQKESAATKKIIDDVTSTSLAKTQHAEVANIIKQFLEQNLRIRSYSYETFKNIHQTTNDIREKISKGE